MFGGSEPKASVIELSESSIALAQVATGKIASAKRLRSITREFNIEAGFACRKVPI